ncbi:MAG: hypothetical protein A2428_13090 [Bdellovibrionales bacterium RIFOXYC1_FULL_54_43]|nr:MAG: hypothetical protein A2428_13090 [Bdellovibrionales bacterium RIFOXYC1_FULL_54_43]OFZ83851.1 MAG: hypothetical protein A2603_08970 [Bdellovibrionales bacterium RIFOXYD1_FULL_55_31]
MRASRLILTIASFFCSLAAFSGSDLVKVSSTYLADNGKDLIPLRGTGTPVEIELTTPPTISPEQAVKLLERITAGSSGILSPGLEQEYRERNKNPATALATLTSLAEDIQKYRAKGVKITGISDQELAMITPKKERVLAILTSSHLLGGKSGTQEIFSASGKKAEILKRCVNADDDLELVLIKTPDISPVAKYNQDRKSFEFEKEDLQAWSKDFAEMPWRLTNLDESFVEIRNKLQKETRLMLASTDLSAVLVPDWVQWRPENASAFQYGFSGALGLTSSQSEFRSNSKIVPGMSGAPLVEGSLGRFKTGKPALLGVSNRVLFDFNQSFFASSFAIRSLVENFKKGVCNPPDKDTSWHYLKTPSGEGVTYRTFKTQWGEFSEINVTQVRAGTVISQPAGNGSSGDGGNGSSGDGGNGSSGDGGNHSTVTIKHPWHVNPAKNDDTWTRFGVRPGLKRDGKKPVYGFWLKPKTSHDRKTSAESTYFDGPYEGGGFVGPKPGLPYPELADRIQDIFSRSGLVPRPFALFGDAQAIQYMKKYSENYTVQIIPVGSDLTPLLAYRLRQPNACYSSTANAFDFGPEDSDKRYTARPSIKRPTATIDSSNNEITISTQIGKDKIKIELNKKGVLKDSESKSFVPIIRVKAKPSGKTYIVDLTRLFFADASEIQVAACTGRCDDIEREWPQLWTYNAQVQNDLDSSAFLKIKSEDDPFEYRFNFVPKDTKSRFGFFCEKMPQNPGCPLE